MQVRSKGKLHHSRAPLPEAHSGQWALIADTRSVPLLVQKRLGAAAQEHGEGREHLCLDAACRGHGHRAWCVADRPAGPGTSLGEPKIAPAR
jgi:hypothetical protein